MIKNNHYNDYVIAAMYHFAREGKPDVVEIKRRMNAADIYDMPALLDLSAVRAALDRLAHEENGALAVKVVEHVYLWDAGDKIKGGVSARAVYAAKQLYISETAVYRILRRMRHLVAEERGLRIN